MQDICVLFWVWFPASRTDRMRKCCGSNVLSPNGGLSVLHHLAAALPADLALAPMDSGRCPVSPSWLSNLLAALSGGEGRGGERTFYRGELGSRAGCSILLILLVCTLEVNQVGLIFGLSTDKRISSFLNWFKRIVCANQSS